MKKSLQKLLSYLVIFSLVVPQLLSSLVVPVHAGVASPWTQTDWSGGSGQNDWNNTTKFSASTTATTAAAGEVTLGRNAEKLTNTTFESDLSSWNTDMATEIQNTQASNLVVYYPMNETSGSVAQAINPAVATGRDIVINGDFASDTDWTKGTGWTISGGTASSDGTQVGLSSITQSPALPTEASKVYEVTFTISNYSVGAAQPLIGATNGTFRSANGTFTEELTAGTSGLAIRANSDFIGDIDNVIVTQKTIAASTDFPGSELLTDGDMEAGDTSAYSAGANATLTKETGTRTGGSGTQVLRIARSDSNNPSALQTILTTGKRYIATGYVRSDGNAGPRVRIGTGTTDWSGTTSTDWQSFSVEIEADNTAFALVSSTSTGTEYTEWDDVSVTEVNPLNGDITGATINQTENAALGKSYSFDGINDYVDIHSAELNSAFDPDEGTLLAWTKVSGAGVWTDSTSRLLLQMRADADNRFFFRRSTTDNQVDMFSEFGTTVKQFNDTSLSGTTNYFMMTMTWDTSADQTKGYLNGSQIGSTLTGLGTWVGNLLTTDTIIGAGSTTPTAVWDGNLSHIALWKTPLTAIEIANLNLVPATRDTSTTNNSSAGSAKLVAISDSQFAQDVNVGDTGKYFLEAFARTDGSAVTSTDLELYYNGSAITTTFTDQGGGWYKLTGTLTGANESRTYGVQVKNGKTVYVDNFALNSYAASGTLTSSIFDSEQASYWGNLAFSSTVPTNTTLTMKVRSSNSGDMSGATDFGSCSVITTGTDLSGTDCVTDLHRFIQYQVAMTNSDVSVTSTLSDVTVNFSTANVEAILDSPGDGSYTNSDRPSFRWKVGSDSTAAVASYNVEVDNGDSGSGAGGSGDFSITGIPVSRTSDYDQNQYRAHYDGFSDGDSENNYISIQTKSTDDWSNEGNDGRLKEGKRTWQVEATNNTGAEHIGSRTLLVDRTGPNTAISQINGRSFASSLATADTTPTIYGRITDPLAGESASDDEQVKNDNRVASGPESLEVKIEKKNFLGVYDLHSLATVNLTANFWEADGKEITDNNQNTSSKYSSFSYTPSESLPQGTYRVTIAGKDKVDNTGGSSSFDLIIGAAGELVTDEELRIIEEATPGISTQEREKAVEVVVRKVTIEGPSLLEKIIASVTSITKNVYWSGVSVVVAMAGAGGNLADGALALWQGYDNLVENFNNRVTAFVVSGVNYQLADAAGRIGSIWQIVANSYNYVASTVPGVVGKGMTGAGDLVATGVSMANRSALRVVGVTATVTGNAQRTVAGQVGVMVARMGEFANDTNVWLAMTAEIYLDRAPTRITEVRVIEVGKDYALISWKTNHHTKNNKVNYGEDRSYGNHIFSGDREKEHEVRISSLEPNTKYVFEVMSQNKNYIYDSFHEFTTLSEQK